jgi:VIT1/CCC1 family predicted Fe2+/Mn2+ transporter
MDAKTHAAAVKAQQDEITEYHIYRLLAKRSRGKNSEVLHRIARDEEGHSAFWKGITKVDVAPRKRSIVWYTFLARTFGVVFSVRLMERGENLAQDAYENLKHIDGVTAIIKDEEAHEQALINMISEEKLDYAGSIVLGLSDALVELTGALAGLTFALQSAKVVAMAGFITGFAASLSMAASGYLQGKEEAAQNEVKSPLKAAMYTGFAYILTVLVLIAPYLLLPNIFYSLIATLALAVLIVAGYTFYIGVAKNLKFWPRFLEMAMISLAVAALSFGVGWLIRVVFGIEI